MTEKLGTPEIKQLDDDEKQLDLPYEDIAEFGFDEMNLIEIPFCLLQRKNTARSSEAQSIALSPSGHEYLQSSGQKYGLPTALAEPVVLGLMWMTMQQSGFQSRRVRFPLRTLVEEYMYPGKFKKYRAGGRLLESVEDELHRVAATRIHSDRWFDRNLGKQVHIDASIIDAITVIEKGGKNSPKVLEVVWGTKVYESIQSRYTKGLDIKTYLQIQTPLARRLYRWVDRQLSTKSVQAVRSCQHFARYKMLMTGKVVERGGRTASNYIVKCFKEVLDNFHDLGFAVRMLIDKSRPDYSLRFERLDGRPENEVVEQDQVGDLVREFLHCFHDVPKDGKKRRQKKSDRSLAEQWLDSYGYDQAAWMVRRCVELHRTSPRRRERVFSFAGLELFEMAAAADYERWRKEQAGQLQLDVSGEDEERKSALKAKARELATKEFGALTESERVRLVTAYADDLPANLPDKEAVASNILLAEMEERALAALEEQSKANGGG